MKAKGQLKPNPSKIPLNNSKNFSTLNKNSHKTPSHQYNSEINYKIQPESLKNEKNEQKYQIVSDSNNQEAKPLDFETLMEQMRAEKQKFYQKLNNLSSRRHDTNRNSFINDEKQINNEIYGNNLNDSGDIEAKLNNFSKYDKNLSGLYEHETQKPVFLDKMELNQVTHHRILEELQKTKENKQQVLNSLNTDLNSKDQNLKKLRTTQDDLKNSLTEFLNSLKEENQDLEKKLENARNSLAFHEKNEKENTELIRNYENEIKKIEEMLEIHKEESEKELRTLSNELEKEKTKYELLSKKPLIK